MQTPEQVIENLPQNVKQWTNANASPKDDFATFATGTWLARSNDADIQRELEQYGVCSIYEIIERGIDETRLIALLQTPETKLSTKQARLMKAFFDAPLSETMPTFFNRLRFGITTATTPEAFGKQCGTLRHHGIALALPFCLIANENSVLQLAIGPIRMGMGDHMASVYRAETSEDRLKVAAYRKFLITLFSAASLSDSERRAQRVIDLETQLAAHQLTREQLRDPTILQQKKTLRELKQEYSHIPWATIVATLPVTNAVTDIDAIICANYRSIEFFNEQFKHITNANPKHIASMQDYMLAHSLIALAPVLTAETVAAKQSFEAILTGSTETLPEHLRRLDMIKASFPESLCDAYRAQHAGDEVTQLSAEIFQHLKRSFTDYFKDELKLTEPTLAWAQEKLGAMVLEQDCCHLNYETNLPDTAALTTMADIHWANKKAQLTTQFGFRGEQEPSPWGNITHTYVLNCQYQPASNRIKPLKGFSSLGQFYNEEAKDPHIRYAILAGVLGHEMSHGFDQNGRQYDAHGHSQDDVWTKDEKSNYDARVDRLNAFYAALRVKGSEAHLDSMRVSSETVADGMGVLMMERAYLYYCKEHKLTPNLPLIYTIWAQLWMSHYTPAQLTTHLSSRPHPPMFMRSDAPLRGSKLFQQTFGITSEDPMYADTPFDQEGINVKLFNTLFPETVAKTTQGVEFFQTATTTSLAVTRATNTPTATSNVPTLDVR